MPKGSTWCAGYHLRCVEHQEDAVALFEEVCVRRVAGGDWMVERHDDAVDADSREGDELEAARLGE